MENCTTLTLGLLVLALFFPSHVKATRDITNITEDCSTGAKINAVAINGCNRLYKDGCGVGYDDETTQGTITFTVTADKPIQHLDCKVSSWMEAHPKPNVTIDTTTIGYCPQTDGCKSIGDVKCPLKKNTQAVYHYAMPKNLIQLSYTNKRNNHDDNDAIKGIWELKDGEQTVICFKIPIHIDPPKPSTIAPSTQSTTASTSRSDTTRVEAAAALILTAIVSKFIV